MRCARGARGEARCHGARSGHVPTANGRTRPSLECECRARHGVVPCRRRHRHPPPQSAQPGRELPRPVSPQRCRIYSELRWWYLLGDNISIIILYLLMGLYLTTVCKNTLPFQPRTYVSSRTTNCRTEPERWSQYGCRACSRTRSPSLTYKYQVKYRAEMIRSFLISTA